MAEKQEKTVAAKAPAAQTDLAGNPVGTTYTPAGIALANDGKPLAGGINLPPLDAGGEYNADGTEFKLPENFDKVAGTYATDLAGLKVAINTDNANIAATTAVMAIQPEDVKHVFQTAIDSITKVRDQRISEQKEMMKQYGDYLLLKEKPSIRGAKAELITIEAEIARLTARKQELAILIGATGAKAKEGDKEQKIHQIVGTDEQKANYATALAVHGTQGKVIVDYVKQGWTNIKISNFLGIAPANIPGPKNVFLRSAAGEAFVAANPGLVDSIK